MRVGSNKLKRVVPNNAFHSDAPALRAAGRSDPSPPRAARGFPRPLRGLGAGERER